MVRTILRACQGSSRISKSTNGRPAPIIVDSHIGYGAPCSILQQRIANRWAKKKFGLPSGATPAERFVLPVGAAGAVYEWRMSWRPCV